MNKIAVRAKSSFAQLRVPRKGLKVTCSIARMKWMLSSGLANEIHIDLMHETRNCEYFGGVAGRVSKLKKVMIVEVKKSFVAEKAR